MMATTRTYCTLSSGMEHIGACHAEYSERVVGGSARCTYHRYNGGSSVAGASVLTEVSGGPCSPALLDAVARADRRPKDARCSLRSGECRISVLTVIIRRFRYSPPFPSPRASGSCSCSAAAASPVDPNPAALQTRTI
jgi:hypothetical protein